MADCKRKTANLFDAATAYGDMYSDGVITGQGNAINGIKNKVTADMIGKTYTISITCLQNASKAFVAITINGTTYWRENELTANQRSSFQFTPVTENDLWYITYNNTGVYSYKDIMFNEGSTPLPYEPYGWVHSLRKLTTATDTFTTLPVDIYADGTNATVGLKGNTVQDGTPTPDNPIMPQGCGDLETVGAKAGQYKIPISSASTITPIYLGEVQTTRAIRKYVFDGTENWNRTSNGTYYLSSSNNPINNYKFINADISINSHFPSQGMVKSSLRVDDGKSAFFYTQSSSTREYYIAARDIPTLADFKSYLAAQYTNGTPVTIWYVLATPKTAVVNEPLQKIGNYADSIASSQAGVSIPTVAGDNTISVDTTVQPSEFTATWTGWHELVGKVFDGTDWTDWI